MHMALKKTKCISTMKGARELGFIPSTKCYEGYVDEIFDDLRVKGTNIIVLPTSSATQV